MLEIKESAYILVPLANSNTANLPFFHNDLFTSACRMISPPCSYDILHQQFSDLRTAINAFPGNSQYNCSISSHAHKRCFIWFAAHTAYCCPPAQPEVSYYQVIDSMNASCINSQPEVFSLISPPARVVQWKLAAHFFDLITISTEWLFFFRKSFNIRSINSHTLCKHYSCHHFRWDLVKAILIHFPQL